MQDFQKPHSSHGAGVPPVAELAVPPAVVAAESAREVLAAAASDEGSGGVVPAEAARAQASCVAAGAAKCGKDAAVT